MNFSRTINDIPSLSARLPARLPGSPAGKEENEATGPGGERKAGDAVHSFGIHVFRLAEIRRFEAST
jgi:hypothetical protein